VEGRRPEIRKGQHDISSFSDIMYFKTREKGRRVRDGREKQQKPNAVLLEREMKDFQTTKKKGEVS